MNRTNNRSNKLITAALGAFVATVVTPATVLLGAGTATANFGGTGTPCSITHVSVTKQPDQTLYVYQADCPGQPLGWYGPNGVAEGLGTVPESYQVIGNWNPTTKTAHDNVFSPNRSQGVLDTWTCTDDPWITPMASQNDSGQWSAGHRCTQQSRRGGDDWTDDTDSHGPFSNLMCFNSPWGACLSSTWANDATGTDAPSAAILSAYESAKPQG